jgi:hypothetical protein
MQFMDAERKAGFLRNHKKRRDSRPDTKITQKTDDSPYCKHKVSTDRTSNSIFISFHFSAHECFNAKLR